MKLTAFVLLSVVAGAKNGSVRGSTETLATPEGSAEKPDAPEASAENSDAPKKGSVSRLKSFFEDINNSDSDRAVEQAPNTLDQAEKKSVVIDPAVNGGNQLPSPEDQESVDGIARKINNLVESTSISNKKGSDQPTISTPHQSDSGSEASALASPTSGTLPKKFTSSCNLTPQPFPAPSLQTKNDEDRAATTMLENSSNPSSDAENPIATFKKLSLPHTNLLKKHAWERVSAPKRGLSDTGTLTDSPVRETGEDVKQITDSTPESPPEPAKIATGATGTFYACPAICKGSVADESSNDDIPEPTQIPVNNHSDPIATKGIEENSATTSPTTNTEAALNA